MSKSPTRFGAGAHRGGRAAFGTQTPSPELRPESESVTYSTAVPGLLTIGLSFVALVIGAIAMLAGYLTFGAVAMIVSLAAATFGAVWLLSGMLINEHHHLHGHHI